MLGASRTSKGSDCFRSGHRGFRARARHLVALPPCALALARLAMALRHGGPDGLAIPPAALQGEAYANRP